MKQNFALDSARTTDENGFLHVSASHITKATINPYLGEEIPNWQELGLKPDAIYYALRDPEELKKSLSTWAGLPLQMEHHAEGADEPDAKETRVGTVGTKIAWNAPYIDAPLTVWDKAAIEAIESGKCREISCAYWYDPDFTSGTFEGQPYDFVMRNIRGNHVALVPEGRAGHDVLVADRKPAQVSNLTQEDLKMSKTRMARDADEGIEAKEVQIGETIKAAGEALMDLHTTDPAGNVVDKPDAADDDLEALKAKYNLTDEALADIKAALMATDDDTEPAAADSDEDKEPAADGEEDKTASDDEGEDKPASDEDNEPAADEDEVIKDAMEKCGLDADDPAISRAFAEGVAYGEKKEKDEPQKLDELHEREGEEAAIKKAEDRALRRLHASINERFKAADKVAPLVGNVRALSFDSAESIYGYALRRLGFNLNGRKPAQYSAILEGYLAGRAPKTRRAATAADAKRTDSKLTGLSKIRLED